MSFSNDVNIDIQQSAGYDKFLTTLDFGVKAITSAIYRVAVGVIRFLGGLFLGVFGTLYVGVIPWAHSVLNLLSCNSLYVLMGTEEDLSLCEAVKHVGVCTAYIGQTLLHSGQLMLSSVSDRLFEDLQTDPYGFAAGLSEC